MHAFLFRLSIALLACVAFTAPASSQTYPSRPVRFISPFPPGGAVDVITRITAAGLQEALGQPVGILVGRRVVDLGEVEHEEIGKRTGSNLPAIRQAEHRCWQ